MEHAQSEQKKLNILMTTMQMGFGGAETHIYELCRALARNGHTVTVASAGGRYAGMLEADGIRHVTLPLSSKNPIAVVRAYRGLKKLLRTGHFDVVHAHARIPAFICGLLQKRLHFRFVTTAHWVFTVTPLWKRLANWGDRQMAVSEDIKQYLIDNYGCFADHISVTVNGIDTESFSPAADPSTVAAELGLSASGHRIVSVSRMDESRGRAQLCLARTAERLLQKYPDLEIVIVGDGVLAAERNLLTDVRAIADALAKKYGRTVIFTPGLRTDTPALIAAGDVFVGASRAALEAMSVGKPVVLAGNEGYLGIFDAGKRVQAAKTNYCFRDCGAVSPEALYTDLCELFDNRDRAALGAYCRRVILEDYSAARTARDYEALYASLPNTTFDTRGEILISGYYGFDNAGDDSIATSIIRGIRRVDPDAKITILCKDPKKNSRKYAVRAINRFHLPAIFREMRHARLLISGGGNLLQNTTSSRSFLYYTTIIRLARKMGLKVYIYANGIGPVFGKKYARAVVRTLKEADQISFREPQSIEYVRSIGADVSRITLSADPALMLLPAPEKRIDYILRDVCGDRFFAVSLRSFETLRSEEVAGMDEERFAALFAKEIDRIADATGAMPLYILMQSGRDRHICAKVDGLAAHKGAILPALTAGEILGVLSRCELVIAMRLHLLIYGAAAAKPLVGVSYDPKIDSMLSYMGYDAPIRVSDLANGLLYERAVTAFGSAAPCARIDALRSLAFADAETAVRMLENARKES